MASQTIRDQRFPVGTSVGVYLAGQKRAGEAPQGSAISSATVAADGTLTFSGLQDGVSYTAYASVSGAFVYADFTTDPPPAGEGLADKRRRLWLPGTVETCMREDVADDIAAPASGTLLLAGGGVLAKGKTLSRIAFVSGTTAGGTLTHQVFCLVRAADLAVVAVTADDVATAWAANTVKELLLATPYTSQDDIAVYLGLLVTATTVPSLAGAALKAAAIGALAPVLAGTSNAGLAGTPASIPANVTAPTGIAGVPYAYAR